MTARRNFGIAAPAREAIRERAARNCAAWACRAAEDNCAASRWALRAALGFIAVALAMLWLAVWAVIWTVPA